MTKSILMVLPLFLTLSGSESNYKEDIEVMDNPIIDIIEPEINLINGKIDNREELIEAMAFIESGGNPNAIGDLNLGTPSVGLLQIRPIMVREVNRILKNQGLEKRFRNKDRKDSTKSIEMFNIWADTYHLNSSYEKMARNWNGGPKGYMNKRTEHYWKKIQNYITLNL